MFVRKLPDLNAPSSLSFILLELQIALLSEISRAHTTLRGCL